MQLYAGLDLHARNTYIGIMDEKFKRIFGKRVSNKLPVILETLASFRCATSLIMTQFQERNWVTLFRPSRF